MAGFILVAVIGAIFAASLLRGAITYNDAPLWTKFLFLVIATGTVFSLSLGTVAAIFSRVDTDVVFLGAIALILSGMFVRQLFDWFFELPSKRQD